MPRAPTIKTERTRPSRAGTRPFVRVPRFWPACYIAYFFAYSLTSGMVKVFPLYAWTA